VVVLYAKYVTSNIHESDAGDKLYFSYDIQLYGSGPARLFRDGQMYAVTWTRDQTKGGLPGADRRERQRGAHASGQHLVEAVSTMSRDMPGTIRLRCRCTCRIRRLRRRSRSKKEKKQLAIRNW